MKTILSVLLVLFAMSFVHAEDAPQRWQMSVCENKLYRLDSATGQVWVLDKRMARISTGQLVEVQGWVEVPTMDQVLENVRQVNENPDPKLRAALDAAAANK